MREFNQNQLKLFSVTWVCDFQKVSSLTLKKHDCYFKDIILKTTETSRFQLYSNSIQFIYTAYVYKKIISRQKNNFFYPTSFILLYFFIHLRCILPSSGDFRYYMLCPQMETRNVHNTAGCVRKWMQMESHPARTACMSKLISREKYKKKRSQSFVFMNMDKKCELCRNVNL